MSTIAAVDQLDDQEFSNESKKRIKLNPVDEFSTKDQCKIVDENSYIEIENTCSIDWEEKIVSAIFKIGLLNSSPKTLLNLMLPNNYGVTSEHIKSHLQKYRMNPEKSSREFLMLYNDQMRGFLSYRSFSDNVKKNKNKTDKNVQNTLKNIDQSWTNIKTESSTYIDKNFNDIRQLIYECMVEHAKVKHQLASILLGNENT